MPRQGKHPPYRESMDSTRRNEEFRKGLTWERRLEETRAQRLAAARWPERVIEAGTAARLARRFTFFA